MVNIQTKRRSASLHYFSAWEYRIQKQFRSFRDKVLQPLIAPLIWLNVSPGIVTLASFICIIAFAFVLTSAPYTAVALLFLHLALDAIDGALARALGTSSKTGALLDILNDHAGFIVVLGALVLHNFINPILGFIYGAGYSTLILLLLYSKTQRVPVTFTIRTKYYLYGVYALWALLSVNYFQIAVLIFSVITLVFLLTTCAQIFFASKK